MVFGFNLLSENKIRPMGWLTEIYDMRVQIIAMFGVKAEMKGMSYLGLYKKGRELAVCNVNFKTRIA